MSYVRIYGAHQENTFEAHANKRVIAAKQNHIQKKLMRFALVFLVSLVLVSILFGAMMNVHAGSAADASTTIELKENQRFVHVASGDTLWEIAALYVSDNGNIRSYMDDIKTLNDLDSSSLIVGQKLLIP